MRSICWENNNETSWFTVDSRHRFKITESLTLSHESALSATNPYGAFTFNSLTDLANNQPALFTRTLGVHDRQTGGVTASVSTSDLWRPSRSVRLIYGLRTDYSKSSVVPRYNPLVDSLFGRRTDMVPSAVALSPRAGMSWIIGGPPSLTSLMEGQGAFRPMLSAGFGVFRNSIANALIGSAADATGLPDDIRQLTCAGTAVPIPDWESYADPSTIPTTCADGSAATVFSSNRPQVLLFDPSFRAPTSVRGTLGFRSRLPSFGRHWQFTLSGTYAHGINGESTIDLNLRRTAQFTLPNENNRPVFAAPSDIVPSTGVVAPGAARISDQFDHVDSYVSDLKSDTRQVTASIASPMFAQRTMLWLSYTHTWSRAQTRGFSSTTSGNPFSVEWGNGLAPIHQFTATWSVEVSHFSTTISANVMSGLPYTPLVAGDVNGDGAFDDRAFVFNPATTSDPSLTSQMTALLSALHGNARDCLQSQLGHIAGANSCHGSWRPNVNINLSPLDHQFGLGNRVNVSFSAVNVLSALDRLVYGPNSTHSWLESPLPDPTLLYVKGFDPSTRTFQYQVNSNFGDTHRRGLNFRPPFQIQLRASINLLRPESDKDWIRQENLTASKDSDELLPLKEIKHRLAKDAYAQLYEYTLSFKDTIPLTPEQVAQIQAKADRIATENEEGFTKAASYLVDHGRNAKRETFYELAQQATPMLFDPKRMMQIYRMTMADIRTILTPAQWAKLPASLRAVAGDEVPMDDEMLQSIQ